MGNTIHKDGDKMDVTSISLSYVFMGVGVILLIAFLYFRVIVAKSADGKPSHDRIVGSMKHPDTWRNKNNSASYVSLFWAVLSIGIFIYLKYYLGSTVIPIWYLFVYAAAIIISYAIFGGKREKAA